MNKEFWKATAIRCARSFISVIMGVWTVDTLVTDIDWKATLLAAFSTTVYIFLACILAGLPEVSYAESLYALENNPNEDVDDFDDEDYEDGDE